MHHPWRRFRTDWGHVALKVEPLPENTRALTDGETVWLHDRLYQAERRCAIEHEMIHLERGEHCAQDEAVEARTDREVARRLIPIPALMDAMAWSDHVEEIADELWVTPEVAQARIDSLLPAQVAIIAELIADLRP